MDNPVILYMEISFFSFFLAQMHAKVLEQKKKVQQVMFFFFRFHNMPFLKGKMKTFFRVLSQISNIYKFLQSSYRATVRNNYD